MPCLAFEQLSEHRAQPAEEDLGPTANAESIVDCGWMAPTGQERAIDDLLRIFHAAPLG